MTEEELHRLNRKALLEVMVEQAKDMEALREQLKARTDELEEAKKALENRDIMINEAGSIAVAALQINGIFEIAQAAGQQYVENVKKLNDRQDKICAEREAQSKAKAEAMIAEAEKKCSQLEAECRERCEEMEREARFKSKAYWAKVSKRLEMFYEDHKELKRLLDYSAKIQSEM